MTDPPFGFGPPGGRGGSGDPGSGPPEPMGPLGDPQQFADALRQFADLMSWQGGPVNWDLAKNVARQTVAAKGDPSVLDVERQKVIDAIRVADLWLEDVTSFPTGIRTAQAWSRSEWVEATLPVWSKLCDPIAARAVDAMGGLLTEAPDELGDDGAVRRHGRARRAGRARRDDAQNRRDDGRRADRRGDRSACPRGRQLDRCRPAARPGGHGGAV